jgi:hypothetical protein
MLSALCATGQAETAVVLPDSTIVPKAHVLRFRRAAPANITFEKKQAPEYKVYYEQESPRIYRGLFRDRVVVPKRYKLSVEAQ